MIPLLIHQLFTYGIFALSLLTNSSFIWIATTTLSDQIGSYRFLMIGFAVMDILVSTIHMVLMPGIQLTSVGYIFFGYHLLELPAMVGTWAGILFVVFFYQTFIILAIHYVYRYAIVCDPWWRRLFVRNRTLWWSLISTLIQLLYTFGYYEAVQIGFMPSSYKAAHYRPILTSNSGVSTKADFGYLAIIFRKPSPINFRPEVWQMDALIAIMIAVGLFGATAIVIVACSILIMRELRAGSASLISAQTRAMQRQLLKALLIQTLTPSIFSYIPLGGVFLVPLTGLNLTGVYGDLMIMSTAIFPAIDPLIMIYFVRSYRARIAHIWRAIVHRNLSQVYSHRSQSASNVADLRRNA